MKNRGRLLLAWPVLWVFFVSCISLSIPQTETAEGNAAFDGGPLLPSAQADPWELWMDGPHLRGANIWQRVVVPQLDGEEFLGGGRVGPPYTQDDFDRLAALGANYVNLSHPGLFAETPPYELDVPVQENLDSLLAMAARADLFAVITFRTGPGRSDFTFYRDGADDWFDESLLIESFWTDPDAQNAWAEMWRHTAERYRGNPVVAGYDLMCEPNADEVALGIYEPEEFYPRYAGTTYDWNRFYPNLVQAIREVDPDTPILVGGMGWGAVRWLPYLVPVEDDRIVYTVHQYEPQSPYTHQEPPAENTYPGEFDLDWDGRDDSFDHDWLEDYLSPIEEFQERYDAPLAVNEFGVARWTPNGDDFLDDQMALFEERGMNHALWVWNPSWRPFNENVNTFDFRFGPDPESTAEVPNELMEVITGYWSRNTVRPSSFNAETGDTPSATSRTSLDDVNSWFYMIGADLDEDMIGRMAESAYDMVVIDFVSSAEGNEGFPMADVVKRLHDAEHPKLAIAYIDTGQAEDFRTYWQPGWGIGDPEWIVGADPDGWAGDFPVAYWHEDWRGIWLGEDGYLQAILDSGFDGVYLDWVEAYSDENVIASAQREEVDPQQEMIRWVGDIAGFVRARRPGFVVIAQNAAELAENAAYRNAVDAIAQEQVWFDGGADDDPPGDCPLPRTEDDVESDAYYRSLSPACRRQYDEFPDGTLHMSSEEYLQDLTAARDNGVVIFTVDYAVDPENTARVYETSRALGFVPFVGNRALDRFVDVWD